MREVAKVNKTITLKFKKWKVIYQNELKIKVKNNRRKNVKRFMFWSNTNMS